MRVSRFAAAVVALAGLSCFAPGADARPQYLKAWAGKYPEMEAQAKSVKCGVCHYGESKKNNNDYGSAMKDALGAKNVKVDADIEKGLTDTEAKPSKTDGKTFGALIKEGKLPGTNPE